MVHDADDVLMLGAHACDRASGCPPLEVADPNEAHFLELKGVYPTFGAFVISDHDFFWPDPKDFKLVISIAPGYTPSADDVAFPQVFLKVSPEVVEVH